MNTSVISDRGPTPYFHGRNAIIDVFNDYLVYFKNEKRGTTFLIQGAPGAGKTALLEKLVRSAQKQKWKAVEIDAPALWDAGILRESIPDRNIFRRTKATFTAGVDNASIEISVKESVQTIKRTLQSYPSENPI